MQKHLKSNSQQRSWITSLSLLQGPWGHKGFWNRPSSAWGCSNLTRQSRKRVWKLYWKDSNPKNHYKSTRWMMTSWRLRCCWHLQYPSTSFQKGLRSRYWRTSNWNTYCHILEKISSIVMQATILHCTNPQVNQHCEAVNIGALRQVGPA